VRISDKNKITPSSYPALAVQLSREKHRLVPYELPGPAGRVIITIILEEQPVLEETIHLVAGVNYCNSRLAFVAGPNLPPSLNPVEPEQMEGILVGFFPGIFNRQGQSVRGFLLSELDSPEEAQALLADIDSRFDINPTIAKTMIVSLIKGLKPISAPEIKSEILRLLGMMNE
jgi:hypothetical protein